MYGKAQKFQSTPGIEAGRSPRQRIGQPVYASFNPRPALKPGDPTNIAQILTIAVVSIHARH
jgi:hypothetical protein